MDAERLPTNPIVTLESDERIGSNVNGPSLIRVPDWVEDPLGEYYLYFSHHLGAFIQFAYADDLEGPWTVHTPGTLHLEESGFPRLRPDGSGDRNHVSAPDVHVDEDKAVIRMYYHGIVEMDPLRQVSRVAVSTDGLEFTPQEPPVGDSYLNVFEVEGRTYGLGRAGEFARAAGPEDTFEKGPTLFPDMRHGALQVDGRRVQVFYSRIGDRPERILFSEFRADPDWKSWVPTKPETVLEPATDYEGADLPLTTSEVGPAFDRVRELRDPEIFVEDGERYLLYAIAGEQGLAVARLEGEHEPGSPG